MVDANAKFELARIKAQVAWEIVEGAPTKENLIKAYLAWQKAASLSPAPTMARDLLRKLGACIRGELPPTPSTWFQRS